MNDWLKQAIQEYRQCTVGKANADNPAALSMYVIRVTKPDSATGFKPGTVIKLITQNPNRSSEWAALARAGHEVIQVIVENNPDNMGGGDYYGVYALGKFTRYQDLNEAKRELHRRVTYKGDTAQYSLPKTY